MGIYSTKNYLAYSLLVLIGYLDLGLADHGSLEDCYSCSQKDNGARYICNYGELFEDKTKIACCPDDSNSEFCKSNEKYNKCSLPFK